MSAQRGGARPRGRGSGARPRVPAFSPRLAIFGISAAFAAVARAAAPAPATGAAAGGRAALRFRALVHVDDMDAEVVLDERDETGDGVRFPAGDAIFQRQKHAEARASREDALAELEERLYGTLRLTEASAALPDDAASASAADDPTDDVDSVDSVASAFRDLFAFVADAPSPARARARLARAAETRAAREGRDAASSADEERMETPETPKEKPDLETLSMLARAAEEARAAATRDARAPLVAYFGEAAVDATNPVTLEPVAGGAGGISVAFRFSHTLLNGDPSGVDLGAAAEVEKGARLLEALASENLRRDAGDDVGEREKGGGREKRDDSEPDETSSETFPRPFRDLETSSSPTPTLLAAARALSRAVEAAAAAAAARNAVVGAETDPESPSGALGDDASAGGDATLFAHNTPLVASLEDLPADWRAVADALYLLASLVELGLAPRTSDAYPEPRIEIVDVGEGDRRRRGATSSSFRAAPDGRWSDVHFVDADPMGAPVEVPTHPALASPKAWAAAAVSAAAEMGSREARLASGDRALRGRGFSFALDPEDEGVFFDKRGPIGKDASSRLLSGPAVDVACERATRVYLLPAAERVADAAEAGGDVRVPSEPPRLRERERDAGYVDDADAEDDGDAQIEMERDMAARGVPEAERHLGYRALMGRGVPRDEGDALRRFRRAADLGDPLATFNLGYAHMRGVGTPVNHTEARLLFERAASMDVAAAHNGVGVLDYNGWATADGGPDVAAARARFEAGAAGGDPDALFNLGTLYQTGGGGLRADHAEAYARYQAASDAGHWRAPLAVAKLTLEGWDPEDLGDPRSADVADLARLGDAEPGRDPSSASSEDENHVSGRVEKNCREAARLLMAFLEERLIVFSDEHEDALAALEGGFVESVATDSAERRGEKSDAFVAPEETEVGPDPWGALVRYARIAERGGEAGLANAAFLAKKAGVGRRTGGTKGARTLPPHLTRRAARDAAREALTRLAAMGDVEARVDLGDVEWAAAVEGDDDALSPESRPEPSPTGVSEETPRADPRPPADPAPPAAAGAETKTPLPPPPRAAAASFEASAAEDASPSEDAFFVLTRLMRRAFSRDGRADLISAAETETPTEDPPRPPAPAAPPRGFARTRAVAFHYAEASSLGLPEGSVSLAWCWSRGVGVPRVDFAEAQRALWKAVDASADEMESFAPSAALVAAAAARAATAAVSFFLPGAGFDAADLVRLADLAFGAKESNAVLYPGSVPGTTAVVPGTSPGTTSGDTTRNGSRARRRDARAAKAADGFFLRVERCVLAALACGFAAVGYARFIALAGEHREATAAFLDGLSPATVAGVAGAVAALAWAAGA